MALLSASLLFGLVIWLSLETKSNVIDLRDTQIPLQTVAWQVLFQDAVLTTSASRFVMSAHKSGWIDEDYTGVPGGVRVYDAWFITYIENVGALDEAIAK